MRDKVGGVAAVVVQRTPRDPEALAKLCEHDRACTLSVDLTRRGREHFKTTVELIKSAQIPEWVSVDGPKLAGTVLSEPIRAQMPQEFNEQLVVEYYSR